MIDHSKCQHANTKSERAKCRARQRVGHRSVYDADLISEQSAELSRVLTREDARASLWVALSSPEIRGYIVYSDADRVLIHDLESGVAEWHDWAKIDGKIFDESPSV